MKVISKPLTTLCLAITIFLIGFGAIAATNSKGADSSDIDSLETRFFEHTYPIDTVDDRISRIEKLVFGETRSGSNGERLANLLVAVPKQDLIAASTPTTITQPAVRDGSTQAQDSSDDSQTSDASDDSGPISDSSDYPRVTALENAILGHTFADEPVKRRLDQLETKAFGKPSPDPDLSSRCDKLERYSVAHLHKAPMAVNTEEEIADNEPLPQYSNPTPQYTHQQPQYKTQPSQRAQLPPSLTHPSYAAPIAARPTYVPPPAHSAAMLDKVTWMERQVYGRTFDDQHLLDRLKHLDATLFPNEKPGSNMELMDQVDELVSAANMLEHHNLKEGTVPQVIASNDSTNQTYYGDPTDPAADQSESTRQPTPTNHPLWRSISHVAEEAGTMAVGSADANSTGPGMMAMGGPGFWF